MPTFSDLQNELNYGQSIAAQSATATVNGSSLDCNDCEAAIHCLVNIGDIGGGTTVDVKLQESSDDSTWSDITGATFTQLTATSDNASVLRTFHNRAARYVRAVATLAGGSPDVLISADLFCRKTSY